MTANTVQARKAKGRIFQQWCRDLIQAYFTHLEPDDVLSASGGQSGVDLILSPKARQDFNYDCECKNQERLGVHVAFKQCMKNATRGKPLLFMKKNRHEALGIMRATDLVELTWKARQYDLMQKRGNNEST